MEDRSTRRRSRARGKGRDDYVARDDEPDHHDRGGGDNDGDDDGYGTTTTSSRRGGAGKAIRRGRTRGRGDGDEDDVSESGGEEADLSRSRGRRPSTQRRDDGAFRDENDEDDRQSRRREVERRRRREGGGSEDGRRGSRVGYTQEEEERPARDRRGAADEDLDAQQRRRPKSEEEDRPCRLLVQQWREQCQRDFTRLLDATRVNTQTLILVMEPELVNVMRLVFGEDLASVFRTYGVSKMVLLTPDSREYQTLGIAGAESVVYVVRPVVTWMRVIAMHVEQNARKSRTWPTTVAATSKSVSTSLSYLHQSSELNPAGTTTFSIILIPEYRVVCDRVLEEEGVKGLVRLYECPLFLIPCGDVLSLEDANFFKTIFVDNDTAQLYYIVRTIMQLQRKFGIINDVKGRGQHAQTVADLLLKCTREEITSPKRKNFPAVVAENPEQTENLVSTTKIDSLIILDRSMDMVTPLATQFTYEGLLAEVLGLDYGTAKVDPSVVSPQLNDKVDLGREQTRRDMNGDMSNGWRSRSDNGIVKQNRSNFDDRVSISLYESGNLFQVLRDVNFGNLSQALRDQARIITPKWMKLKGTLDQNKKEGFLLPDPELQNLLSEFASLQKDQQYLRIHSNIAEKITQATRNAVFLARLQYEQRVVATGDAGRNPLLEQAINAGEKLVKVLRLLCLTSVIGGGLAPESFNRYRKLLIAKYGLHHICTLDNLESAGLLTPIVGKQVFPRLREVLRLVVPEAQNGQPFDIAYTHSGYAPLSIRLVEAAANDGWRYGDIKQFQNALGPVFGYNLDGEGNVMTEDERERGDGKTTRKDRSPRSRDRNRSKEENIPRGGMTYAEAAALRFLSSRGPTQYLMATTKLLTGDSFLDPLIEYLD